jgi:hypothetical protein
VQTHSSAFEHREHVVMPSPAYPGLQVHVTVSVVEPHKQGLAITASGWHDVMQARHV